MRYTLDTCLGVLPLVHSISGNPGLFRVPRVQAAAARLLARTPGTRVHSALAGETLRELKHALLIKIKI